MLMNLTQNNMNSTSYRIMGCLCGTEFFVPNFIIHTLTLMGFILNLISPIFCFISLKSPSHQTRSLQVVELRSSFTALHRELLPVVKFSDLVDPPDCCVVCLSEFEAGEEICRLSSCKHVFHRCCIDRWMDYDRKTCPLCWTPFIPEGFEETYEEDFWVAVGTTDYSLVPSL